MRKAILFLAWDEERLMNYLAEIKHHRRLIFSILMVLVATVIFETGQQYYYITRYNLVEDISFLHLFKTHLYKWLVWLILSTPLIIKAQHNARETELKNADIRNYAIQILLLVATNIIIISFIELIRSGEPFSILLFTTEFLPFHTFQKVPLYVLGYFLLAVMLHFYFASKNLQVQVQEFGDLKKINSELYEKLSHTVTDRATVLSIKIGNSQKVIPMQEISWIEADDYCVRVHTRDSNSYLMRMSLKALEEILSSDFLRVHRKAIVNVTMIDTLESNGSHYLILKDLTEVPVAKSKLKMVKTSIAI